MPTFSFIILTYNSEKHISNLLDSIEKHYGEEIKSGFIEIIIVDNASTDKTLSQISKFKKVKIVKNQENLGFAKGVNIGASHAQGKYFIIINPDVTVNGESLEAILTDFENDPTIGVVGGRIYKSQSIYEKSVGRFLYVFNVFVMSIGLDELLGFRSSPSKRCNVDYVSGAFLIVRASLFRKVDGFDENMFMYVEDMEFCFRVKQADYKVIFDPSISINHESHGSSNRSFAIKNIYSGILYFHKKHGTSFSYFMVKSILVLKAASLVIIGKILNNKYLSSTYKEALKI